MTRAPGGAAPGRLAGIVAVACAAVLWAVGATVASALFAAGVDPVELVEARVVVAAAALAPFVLWSRRPSRGAAASRVRVVAYGIVIAIANVTFFLALDRLQVAVAIVLQNLAPGLVMIWMLAASRRRPSGRGAATLAATAVGVALIVELPAGAPRVEILGVVLALATAAAVAAFSLLGEGVGAKYGTIGGTFRAFAVASCLAVVYQAPHGPPETLFSSPGVVAGVAVVGIAGTLAPFVLFSWGVARARAEAASLAISVEPVAAAIIAWVALDQALTPLQALGGVVVVGAVAVLGVDGADRARSGADTAASLRPPAGARLSTPETAAHT